MSKATVKNDHGFRIVLYAATFMLFIKLFFSANVYGSNDITYWIQFSRIIEKYGTFRIYGMCSIYNHPPLMSWVLKLIHWIDQRTQLGFPYLFRLMPIIADFLSILVIWKLLEKYGIKERVLICLGCVLNPVNFFISGFHGNTDPVFIFFILFSIYLIEDNKIVLAGTVYGLSLCIKIVPLILVPVFFYYLKKKRPRTLFFMSSLLLPLIVYLPYLFYDHSALINNIFSYNSLSGIWGIGHVLSSLYNNRAFDINVRNGLYEFLKFYTINFKLVFVLAEVFLVSYLTRHKNINLLELSFSVFCLFLIFTPGFGIQYLSWLSFFAIILFPLLGCMYVLLGGIFLYRVYIYWGGGQAPYYANSIVVGQWGGPESVLDIILWLLIVIMFIKFLIDRKIFSYVK